MDAGRPSAAPPLELAAPPPADSKAAAKVAGLRHVDDQGPGLRRVRRGPSSFRYVDAAGKPVRDAETLARIKALGIPPAWQQVWVCPDPRGHLQATGRDAKGRKQYRYHAAWRAVRDGTKYGKLIDFGAALPALRERTERDLARPGLPREKVLAAVVRLLEGTLIRVGNEEYAKQNGSFGLTTMRDRHVKIDGADLRFRFRGKSGVEHSVDVRDRKLARIVRQCRELPGQELFQYLDEAGERHAIGSADVNDYLREATGQDFTAKDFRTWAGTVLALMALQEFGAFDSQAQAKRNVVDAVRRVAARLGNTPSVCRKCYIHPVLLDAYLDGTMLRTLKRRAERALVARLARLQPEEAVVLAFLQARLRSEVGRRQPAPAQPVRSLRPSVRPPGRVALSA
jgi:DNA topoisomerase I